VINPGAPGGSMITDESIGYRFISAPRISDIRHTDYKVDIGLRGDLGDGWHYDVYGQYGVSTLQTLITGYGSLSKIQNALNVVDNAAGQPVCVVGGSCVPLDIFTANSTSITPAALNYATLDGLTTGFTTQQIVSGSLTGDLGKYGIKSPFTSDGVGVAFGGEYRRDTLQINYDAAQQSGDLSGGGGQALPTSGATDVKEVFAEIRIPLVSDKPLIKSLVFDGGYRFSYYEPAGATNTWKIEGDYAPIDDLRFRASFNHAVRAPNVDDLYLPQTTGLAAYVDPCALTAAGGPPTATLQQCENTGMTAAEYGTVAQCASSQCSARYGGPNNPSTLKPEDADTYSVGVVLTPTFIHGFSGSIDYFHIKVNNVIEPGIAAPQTILDGCLASATSPYCALIHRDSQGSLETATGYIDQLSINAGYLETSGIDMAATYKLPLENIFKDSHLGSLQWSFVGTYTFNLIEEPTPGGPTFDCAGLYGNECASAFGSAGVTPHFKSELRTTWNTPWKVQVSLNWRHISGVALDLNQTNPLLNEFPGFDDSVDAHISNYDYFDLTATWKVKDGIVLRVGCNNLFDRDPPIVDSEFFGVSSPPFGNGNTFPGVYDSLGRNIFVGLTADF
jgi:outer membrane receptor protein involved in Fe transport